MDRNLSTRLSDFFTIANFFLIIAYIAYVSFATKSSDVAQKLEIAAKEVAGTVLAVERAVKETNVDIARNAGDIRSLTSSVTAILAELSNLQLLLKNLYDSLLEIISAKTEDRFRSQDARADWLEFQKVNSENGLQVYIPERYSK